MADWPDARMRRLEGALEQVSRREITRADFRAVWRLDIDSARARVQRWRTGQVVVCRKRPWHTDDPPPQTDVRAWRKRRHERMAALAEAVTGLVRWLAESTL